MIRRTAGKVPARCGAAVEIEGQLTPVRVGDVGDELDIEAAGRGLELTDGDRTASMELIVAGRGRSRRIDLHRIAPVRGGEQDFPRPVAVQPGAVGRDELLVGDYLVHE